MNIDVVIVSNASDFYMGSITKQAIETAIKNESEVEVNVFVSEFNKNVKYDSAETIYQNIPFCYNKCLNEAAGKGSSGYIAFCNNDLIFGNDWAKNLIEAMELYEVNSASSFCPISHFVDQSLIKENTGVHFGYKIREYFSGWMFCWRRSLWERIKLDERVNFWTSDNCTIHQLMEANEKHILVTNSLVWHIDNGSQSLFRLPHDEREKLMYPDVRKFNKYYNQNLFSLGSD